MQYRGPLPPSREVLDRLRREAATRVAYRRFLARRGVPRAATRGLPVEALRALALSLPAPLLP